MLMQPLCNPSANRPPAKALLMPRKGKVNVMWEGGRKEEQQEAELSRS